ncbi:MAG: phosphopentomutase/phosphoglucosamine mutase [Methanomicrobiales archaeon]|nr:phosphopentomutase/phosphoglucosamine mutase [Methanomicrobiales archaeon]
MGDEGISGVRMEGKGKFGSSGIRQLYGRDLIELSPEVGAAFACMAQSVVVGRDTRTTSLLIMHGLISGLLSGGAMVLEAGMSPTPSIGYTARYAKGAAMITASHNPEEYNGIKLMNADGSAVTRVQRGELEKMLGHAPLRDWDHQGEITHFDAIEVHKNAILDTVNPGKQFSAVVDCGNGAGSLLTPYLLDALGQKTITLNCNPSGRFARPSEPLPANLPYLEKVMAGTGADFALIHDGDADRLVVFLKGWGFVSGDDLLILFAKYQEAERVVTTYDASMAIEEVAEVRRVPVGDAYVSEELLRWGDFGGEPSGAIIFPNLSFCPDGIHAAALFCELASEMNVIEELKAIPRYIMLRESFPCAMAREVVIAMGAEEPTDGVRISTEDGWLLVRASGTEPKIRITAEGRTKEAAKRMMGKAKKLVRKGHESI